jgi:hypothetical protein
MRIFFGNEVFQEKDHTKDEQSVLQKWGKKSPKYHLIVKGWEHLLPYVKLMRFPHKGRMNYSSCHIIHSNLFYWY